MAKKKQVLPQYIASPLNNPMINYEAYYMSAAEKLLYSLLLILVGGLVGLIFYGGLFKRDGAATLATRISNGVVFLGVGLAARKVFLPAVNQMLLNRRKKALQKQFMDMLETLGVSLSSGNTMHDAVVNAKTDLLNQYSEKDYIIIELNEIVSGIENGQTLEVMLQDFGMRSGVEDIVNFSNVVSNCYRLGGNFSDVVRHTREILGDKMTVSDEIATKVASNKLQHNAMCVMPIALVGLLKVVNPDFAGNLATAMGVVVTTIAVGIIVAAYFWGRKIMDIG